MAIMSPTSFAFLFAIQSYSLLLYDRSVEGHELSIVSVGVAAFRDDEDGLPETVDAAAMVASFEVVAEDV